ncbi:MAG TPA: signal peptidase I [Blastocatellia bacterium]|nr:signal peptidase I [Blastocatellia bacterium]
MRAYDGINADRGREVTLETPEFLEQARLLLAKGLPVVIRMSGTSMRPAIEDGDLVTVEPQGDQIARAGDVILYHSVRETAVIHRVVRIDRAQGEVVIITRGDASSQNDLPVPSHRVLGRVKMVERAGERIDVVSSRPRLRERLRAWLTRLINRPGQ